MTEHEVCLKVRSQIAYALEQDRKGGESIMKEVWEELEDDEYAVADRELRRIITFLVPGFKFK